MPVLPLGWAAAATILGASLASPCAALAGTQFAMVATFGPNGGPSVPQAGLTMGGGNIYGTAQLGGAFGSGAVFQLVPGQNFGSAAQITTIYSFGAQPGDAAYPGANLITAPQGRLLGTSQNGGEYGFGAVFGLKPPTKKQPAWTDQVLYSFANGADGANPVSPLIRAPDGTLYGTTSRGGLGGCNNAGCGVAFSLTPPAKPHHPWTFTTLYEFTGSSSDGGMPVSGLVLRDGALFGVAESGGSNNAGTVYELMPPKSGGTAWTASALYNFTGGADGGYPIGTPVFDKKGRLYGTTLTGGVACALNPAGCGTVFRLTPSSGSWTLATLYAFTGGADGAAPVGGLYRTSRGIFYGTTEGGDDGGVSNYGSVFSLKPAGGAYTETTLHTFTHADGATPRGNLLPVGKAYFGLTAAGGPTNSGTAFQLAP